jgi:arabinogalactan endo-1,4-beta-galactosidase
MLWKVMVNFVISVHLSAPIEQFVPSGWIFLKFDMGGFTKICQENSGWIGIEQK